jgi:hypothetical protein
MPFPKRQEVNVSASSFRTWFLTVSILLAPEFAAADVVTDYTWSDVWYTGSCSLPTNAFNSAQFVHSCWSDHCKQNAKVL